MVCIYCILELIYILTRYLYYSATANIIPTYLGTAAPNKKIDFCLHIEPGQSHTIEDQTAVQAIIKLGGPLEPPSINHTDFDALIDRPITVSIETKRFGGDTNEGCLQIGVWHAAQWNLLCKFLPVNGKVAALESLSFLPAIMVSGHDWTFAATTREGDKTILWIGPIFGDTQSAIGTYKVVRVIQELAVWSRDTYWPWFKENILRMPVTNISEGTQSGV